MNRVYKWYLRMHNSNYAFIRRSIEVMLHIIFSCDIPPEVKIGKNCKFAHNALGVVLHPKVVIYLVLEKLYRLYYFVLS